MKLVVVTLVDARGQAAKRQVEPLLIALLIPSASRQQPRVPWPSHVVRFRHCFLFLALDAIWWAAAGTAHFRWTRCRVSKVVCELPSVSRAAARTSQNECRDCTGALHARLAGEYSQSTHGMDGRGMECFDELFWKTCRSCGNCRSRVAEDKHALAMPRRPVAAGRQGGSIILGLLLQPLCLVWRELPGFRQRHWLAGALVSVPISTWSNHTTGPAGPSTLQIRNLQQKVPRQVVHKSAPTARVPTK